MRILDNTILSLAVHIQGENGSSGSGFYVRNHNKIFLATALHVLKDDDGFNSNIWVLTSYNHDNRKSILQFKIDTRILNSKSLVSKDVILVEICEVYEEDGNDESLDFLWRTIPGTEVIQSIETTLTIPTPSIISPLNDVLVSNEVYIIGYPISLGDPEGGFGQQIEKNRPLLRKGIIAGINWKNETIILDCAAYFGNSGGIAIEIEEITLGIKNYKVIGVVAEFIPFVQHLYIKEMKGVVNRSIENSGYSVVVPMDTIIELTAKRNDKPADPNKL